LNLRGPAIVKPETLLAWNRQQKRKQWTYEKRASRPGRPRKGGNTEALIVRLAEEDTSFAALDGILKSGSGDYLLLDEFPHHTLTSL
jgi:hypothetical protein